MKTLFDTTILGKRTLKNRIWRSATWLALADAEGNVTDEIVKTYEELTKGGAAMIVTGLTSIVEHDASFLCYGVIDSRCLRRTDNYQSNGKKQKPKCCSEGQGR